MTTWRILDPNFTLYDLGFLPEIISDYDSRPVKEQLAERYAHGGGYRPMQGFKMSKNHVLHYPGDPPFLPCFESRIGTELIVFYRQASLLAIIQLDGSFEVTRVD